MRLRLVHAEPHGAGEGLPADVAGAAERVLCRVVDTQVRVERRLLSGKQ